MGLDRAFSRNHLRPSRRILLCFVLLLLVVQIYRQFPDQVTVRWRPLSSDAPTSYISWGPFEDHYVHGFAANLEKPGLSCGDLEYNSTVKIQNGTHLQDDLVQVATTLKSHPMVVYPKEFLEQGLSEAELIRKTWARLSGSSVYLSTHNVFLTVTRVFFYHGDNLAWPTISFVRGQLFDLNWVHLDNYTISLKGSELTFPLVFDIPAEYETGGGFYGPEDPRIIIEEGVQDPEPVIVFNLLTNLTDPKRAMHTFRPFSGHFTMLTLADPKTHVVDKSWDKRDLVEKNWAPFFLSPPLLTPNAISNPSEHLHFVYSFDPLCIVKCHLLTGDCHHDFVQDIPKDRATPHRDVPGSLRGGTNFIQVPLPSSSHTGLSSTDSQVGIYAAFPRTNIAKSCWDPFYRPEFVIMISLGTSFHIVYASDSLSFGAAVMDPIASTASPCGIGRILIANSIPLWDTEDGRDVMTVTFSVNDETVQVARISGLLDLIYGLPALQRSLGWDAPGAEEGGASKEAALRYSIAGDDTRACCVEAAANYSLSFAGEYGRAELARKKENEMWETLEKERKLWEAERAKWEDERKAWEGKDAKSKDDGESEGAEKPLAS